MRFLIDNTAEMQTNIQNVIKEIVHMSRWNIIENIPAWIGK